MVGVPIYRKWPFGKPRRKVEAAPLFAKEVSTSSKRFMASHGGFGVRIFIGLYTECMAAVLGSGFGV